MGYYNLKKCTAVLNKRARGEKFVMKKIFSCVIRWSMYTFTKAFVKLKCFDFMLYLTDFVF